MTPSAILICFQHQQQVVTAVERAKQVTMSELNSIIGVSDHFSRAFSLLLSSQTRMHNVHKGFKIDENLN